MMDLGFLNWIFSVLSVDTKIFSFGMTTSQILFGIPYTIYVNLLKSKSSGLVRNAKTSSFGIVVRRELARVNNNGLGFLNCIFS